MFQAVSMFTELKYLHSYRNNLSYSIINNEIMTTFGVQLILKAGIQFGNSEGVREGGSPSDGRNFFSIYRSNKCISVLSGAKVNLKDTRKVYYFIGR